MHREHFKNRPIWELQKWNQLVRLDCPSSPCKCKYGMQFRLLASDMQSVFSKYIARPIRRMNRLKSPKTAEWNLESWNEMFLATFQSWFVFKPEGLPKMFFGKRWVIRIRVWYKFGFLSLLRVSRFIELWCSHGFLNNTVTWQIRQDLMRPLKQIRILHGFRWNSRWLRVLPLYHHDDCTTFEALGSLANVHISEETMGSPCTSMHHKNFTREGFERLQPKSKKISRKIIFLECDADVAIWLQKPERKLWDDSTHFDQPSNWEHLWNLPRRMNQKRDQRHVQCTTFANKKQKHHGGQNKLERHTSKTPSEASVQARKPPKDLDPNDSATRPNKTVEVPKHKQKTGWFGQGI